MTTIAWDGRTLAADTLITCGSTRDGYATKIHEIDGVLYGASGTSTHSQTFFRWVRDGSHDKCPLIGLPESEGTNAIAILRYGTVRTWCNSGSWDFKPHEGLYAIGSGCECAIGAMSAGVGAEEAVRIAMRHDTKTGGDVTVLSLHESDCAVHSEPAFPAGPCSCR